MSEISIREKCGLLVYYPLASGALSGKYRNGQMPKNSRQALLAFKGDVYTGFNLNDWKSSDFDFAQKRLRILSGLYGMLRPLDLIQAYRLEMGTNFKNKRGGNLYEFWGDRVTDTINEDLVSANTDVLINLASNEYFKAVKPKVLDCLTSRSLLKPFW